MNHDELVETFKKCTAPTSSMESFATAMTTTALLKSFKKVPPAPTPILIVALAKILSVTVIGYCKSSKDSGLDPVAVRDAVMQAGWEAGEGVFEILSTKGDFTTPEGREKIVEALEEDEPL